MDLWTFIIDFLLIALGYITALATQLAIRFKVNPKDVGILIQFVIFFFRMAKWYMETHPKGKKMAKETRIDEEMNEIYQEHLENVDPYKGLVGMEILPDEKTQSH